MVQFIPAKDDWADAFRQIGTGVVQGYTKRADENAIRKAVEALGPNASSRDILNALTNLKTYGNEAKQNFLNNYLGVENFELLKQRAQQQEVENQELKKINSLKSELAETEKQKKLELEKNDSLNLIDFSAMAPEEKDLLREKIKNGEASYSAVKDILKAGEKGNKLKESEESKKTTQRAFNEIVSLIPKVGISGVVTSKLGGDTAKSYAQFTSLTGALEAHLVEQVNRGALSNTRFKYITETLLPKPSDSQAEITGKLTGLATILDLDPAALGAKENKKSDSKGRPPLSSFEK